MQAAFKEANVDLHKREILWHNHLIIYF